MKNLSASRSDIDLDLNALQKHLRFVPRVRWSRERERVGRDPGVGGRFPTHDDREGREQALEKHEEGACRNASSGSANEVDNIIRHRLKMFGEGEVRVILGNAKIFDPAGEQAVHC